MPKLSGLPQDGRVVKNIIQGTLDHNAGSWTRARVGGGTTVYTSNGRTVTIAAENIDDRIFLSRSVAVTNGDILIFRFEISDKIGTFSRENIDITGDLASSIEVNDIEEGLRAVVVTADADGTINFRIGIGIDNTDSRPLPKGFTASNIQCERFTTATTAPSEYVDTDSSNRASVGFARDILSTVGTPGSGALLTESYGPTYSFINDFGVAFITDSFGDESDEMVKRYEAANLDKFVTAISVGGAQLSEVTNADIDTVITQGVSINAGAVQPGTIVLERVVNDIIQNKTAVATLAVMQDLTDYAESIGLAVIVCTCPPFGNNSNHSAARETEALAYNSGLVTQYASNDNVFVYDLFDTLVDGATFDLDAAFDSGDGLHPNLAAADQIAIDLEAVRATIPSRIVTTLNASSSSAGAGLITAPLTSGVLFR